MFVIGRRLISVFLVVLVSSMMFLSSPAVAATATTTIDPNNFRPEVIESKKPVVIILATEDLLKEYPNYLEETKTKAEKFYGDKYKIAIGTVEENQGIYDKVNKNYYDTGAPAIVGFKYGRIAGGIILSEDSTSEFKKEFEIVKNAVDNQIIIKYPKPNPDISVESNPDRSFESPEYSKFLRENPEFLQETQN